jgi:arylsulfatase A-like enzyme/tetratricopeptide (TPR) repeat protein
VRPNRRPWKLVLASSLVLAFLAAAFRWWSGPAPPTITRSSDQNVLLITVDTLRNDAVGPDSAARTPNLDRLAREGFRFDAHTHAVVTLPAHASIFTGLYPFVHGIRDNTGYRLSPAATTIATLLKTSGFATGAFVGAFPLDSRFGLGTGFDEYDDKYGDTNRLGDLVIPERPAEAVVRAAREWIGRQSGRWFAWVHVYDPHSPYSPPAPFDREYAGQPYAGEVAYVDRALGPLLDDARRGPRSATIVVTSDHGEALGSHGEETHGLFAYEPTLRVPLVISLTSQPDAFRAVRGGVPAQHVDLLPTILDALALEAPASLPGVSLLKMLESGSRSDRASYFEAMSASLNRGWAPLTGVIVGTEKYIDLPIPELYDVAADPDEQDNLLHSDEAKGSVLRARLHAFGPTRPSQERTLENPEVVRRLSALGYVSGSTKPKETYTEDDDPKRLIDLDRAIQQGVALASQGQPARALQIYRDLVGRRPTMALGYLHAAYLLWEMGQPAEAIDTLQRAVSAGAVTPELQAQLGIYLAESGKSDQAIALLTPLGTGATADVDALNGLGIAQARGGRESEALRTFEAALHLDPTNATALQNIGSVQIARGDLRAARVAFTGALALDPALASALNGLGIVEMKSGNRAAAIAAWQRAVASDARQFDTLFNLGVVLMEDGQRDQARRYLEQFVATAPPAFYGADLVKVRAWLAAM